MTNLVAMTVLIVTNSVEVSLHPSNREMHRRDEISTRHIYTINGELFTNHVRTVTNTPERYVWKKEKLQRNPLGVIDMATLPPMPSVNSNNKKQ